MINSYTTIDDFKHGEIMPYLGGFADDFDADAIAREASEYDGHGFVMRDEYADDDAFWKLCMRHDTSAKSTVTNKHGRKLDFESVVHYMDKELAEELHMELAPCSDQEFFDAYCTAHERKFGEPWELVKQSPVW